jgi:hypothetical protein
LYALTIINHSSTDHQAEKNARLILKKAAIAASATDNIMHELFRYDLNITNGITSVVKEHKITDLILGLHIKQGMTDSFLGTLTEGILTKCNATTLIYKPNQPFVTIKRHIIIVPQNAEKEIGFPFWILKVWNIARNSGARLIFHASPDTIRLLKEIQVKHPITCTFSDLPDWDDLKPLIGTLQEDDNLIFVLSRRDRPSYLKNMDEIPVLLNSAARHNNFILIYPAQSGVNDPATIDLTNPALVDPMAAVDDIRKTIQKLLGRK